MVTGSSRGIGRAIAERMAQHGARVVVSSRSAEACEPVAAAIRAARRRGMAVACNIGRKVECQALVEQAAGRLGPGGRDGVQRGGQPAFRADADHLRRRLGPHHGHQHPQQSVAGNLVAPGMAERGGGTITIVSSIAGLRGTPTLGAYAVSKAADMQLVRNLAVEWGPRGIRANAIAPGLVRTDFARALWEDEANLRRRTRDTPLGRIGEPDEIAGAAVFLAAAAGRFMTGQTIVIDGGVTAGSPARPD